jgi:hypothetical protein
MGEQGAEGAWSNGYNPHWAQDQQPAPAPTPMPQAPQLRQERQRPAPQYQPQAAQQAAPIAAPVATSRVPDGYGDARDNPNNTMSMFENPDTHQRYYDFDNPALQASPGGTFVEKNATSAWNPIAIYADPSSQFYDPTAAAKFAASQPALAAEVARSTGGRYY